MTEDGERWATRRALLAAGVSGVAAVAGCPGASESTPESAGDGGPSGDGSAPDGSTDTHDEATPGTDTPAGTNTPAETAAEPPTDLDPETVGELVLVDQVGYRPGDPKRAVVRVDAETFAVFDADGEAVASGDLSAPTDDDASGDTVRHAAFDGVTEPGTYRLAVGDGTVRQSDSHRRRNPQPRTGRIAPPARFDIARRGVERQTAG